MLTRILFLTLAAFGTCCWTSPAFAVDPIPLDKFSETQELIKPGEGEWLWAKIPWLTDVWQARRKAAAEGKPLLIWAGMGHPLGVT